MSDLWKIKRTRKAGVKPNINQFTDSQTVIWNQADGKLWGLRIDGDGNRHVVLIGGGINTIGETHARLHAIDSEDDHAPAQEADYGNYVWADETTGKVEFDSTYDPVKFERIWFNCDVAVQVNKFVYIDHNDNIVKLSDNSDIATLPVFGIVTSVNEGQCRIKRLGEKGGFVSIIPNKRYFLGTAGAMLAAPPNSGAYVVRLAQGRDSHTIILDIENILIKTK
jgi:hypothetical protein